MGSSGRSGERLRNGLSETAEPPHQGVQRIGYAAARYATDAEALISSMSLLSLATLMGPLDCHDLGTT